jgi:prepilin-type N-terminal cleavage/methylation domain-containing protein
MRIMRPRQRGFTLIEMVVAMAVAGIILAAVGYSILQVFNLNTRNTNYMTAVREVQSAGYWVTRDAAMAPYDLNRTPPWITANVTSLSLRWRDSTDISATHSASFTWNSANKTLWRSYDGGPAAPIAQHISSASFALTQDAVRVSKVTLVVTASVTSRGITGTETRSYEVSPRPGQSQ